MKISIYKVDNTLFEDDSSFEWEDLNGFLHSSKYEQYVIINDEEFCGFSITVWVNSGNRKKLDWQSEIENLIHPKEDSQISDDDSISEVFNNLGDKYNCILMISKGEEGSQVDLFAIPFGHAYNIVEEICEPRFGLDVASRIFSNNSLTITNVNKYFQSALRQLTNYKHNTNVQSKSSESYDALNGKPIKELVPVLGNTVNCGKSVSVSKYNLHEFLTKMLVFFEEYEKINCVIDFPKVERLSKSSLKSNELSEKLLEQIVNNENVLVNIIGYKIVGEALILVESEIESVFMKSNKKASRNMMESETQNLDTILNYIKANEERLGLADYQVEVNTGGNNHIFNLIDIMQSEIEYDGKVYVLSDGYWCAFNDSYVNKLDDYISNITIKLNTNLSKYNGQIELNTSEEKITEKDYIEFFREDNQYLITHTELIKPLKDEEPFGSGIELCDIVVLGEGKELVSIKKGLSTSTSAYSIDQSLLSLEVIANQNSFETNSLTEHLNAQTIAIQWILPRNLIGEPDDNVTHTMNVLNGTFELKQLRSILLKNKLMEWDSKVKEIGKTAKMYLDSPKKS